LTVPCSDAALDSLREALYEDGKVAVQHAAALLVQGEDQEELPGPLELSLVLCDDSYIRRLNKEWRGIDAATDVLSFDMEGTDEEDFEWDEEFSLDNSEDEEDEIDAAEGWDIANDDTVGASTQPCPVTMLGDVVISLDTASRQASERGHSLRDECRILLVHGILHLLGYDHEQGGEDEEEMSTAENRILKNLGWSGHGLIAAAAAEAGAGREDHGNAGNTPGG